MLTIKLCRAPEFLAPSFPNCQSQDHFLPQRGKGEIESERSLEVEQRKKVIKKTKVTAQYQLPDIVVEPPRGGGGNANGMISRIRGSEGKSVVVVSLDIQDVMPSVVLEKGRKIFQITF